MLIDTILNPMGMLTSSEVLKRVPNFIPKFNAPIGLLGVAKIMCEVTFLFIKTMTILGIQPITTLFHLVAKLCESGGTLDVVFKSKDIFCTSHSFPSNF
jgi:hypothetical protein